MGRRQSELLHQLQILETRVKLLECHTIAAAGEDDEEERKFNEKLCTLSQKRVAESMKKMQCLIEGLEGE